MDYVYVDADVTLFQGQNQLNVKRIRKADEGEYHPADYLPVTTKDIPTMQHELTQYITTIKNEYLRKLASRAIFNDPGVSMEGRYFLPIPRQRASSRLRRRTFRTYLKCCKNVRLLQ